MATEGTIIFEVIATPYVEGAPVSCGLFREREDAERALKNEKQKKHYWAFVTIHERILK